MLRVVCEDRQRTQATERLGDVGDLHSLSKDLTGAGYDRGLRYRLLGVGSSGSSDKRAFARVCDESMSKAAGMHDDCRKARRKAARVESWKWKCGIVVSKFRALAEVAKQRLSFRSNASCPKNYKVIQFIVILL